MENYTSKPPFCESVFNTLGQSGTDQQLYYEQKVVFGNGTDGKNSKSMKGRAKRKMVTQKLILSLIDVAKEKGDRERVQYYWNAYHCQNLLTSADGRVFGKYCKTRCCTICQSIRKAELVNRYLPILKGWSDTRFVTLTAKAVTEDRLQYWIRVFKIAFKRTYQRINKRYQRGKGIKVMGLKSLECNFNPIEKTYNPHFHIVVPNCEISRELIIEWQRTWNKKEKLTNAFAQDTRRVNDNEKCLIETMKYGCKIFTDPTMKKGKGKIEPIIYAAAMDNIFSALKGTRLFDRFGFQIPPKEKYKSNGEKIISNSQDWIYDLTVSDWVNPDTGELLTGYIAPPSLKHLLNFHIDNKLT